MNPTDKPLIWLRGEVRTPPFSEEARIEAGYRIDDDAILIVEVFAKRTGKTPQSVIATCRQRARKYDQDLHEEA